VFSLYFETQFRCPGGCRFSLKSMYTAKRFINYIYIIMFTTSMATAQHNKQQQRDSTYKQSGYHFDLQGHRGARGLAPENTLQAFLKAFAVGINTMELDVVVTKDGEVVVSHEPWMHSSICRQPDGATISEAEEKGHNIYKMTYREVKEYDCGSLFFEAFPEQKLAAAHKPLLKEVLHMIDSLAKNHGRKINYNIELKSRPEGDGVYHPTPDVFSDLVVEVIENESTLERVSLQSFDFRVLRYLHTAYPEIQLAALVYEGDPETTLSELGFTPHIYSPYYKLVDKQLVKAVHARDMKIIPWTVNETADMKRLLTYGVDGLITDYPDRALPFQKR